MDTAEVLGPEAVTVLIDRLVPFGELVHADAIFPRDNIAGIACGNQVVLIAVGADATEGGRWGGGQALGKSSTVVHIHAVGIANLDPRAVLLD